MVFTFTLFTSLAALTSARFVHEARSISSPCFLVGLTALPAEVAAILPSLAGVTCNANVQVKKGVPDVISGGIAFSTIDFAKDSNRSPLAFSLEKFSTPANPKSANLAIFQNQLNAIEVALRSQGASSVAAVASLKVPRIMGNTAEIKHQAAKVLKNAVGASAAETLEVHDLIS